MRRQPMKGAPRSDARDQRFDGKLPDRKIGTSASRDALCGRPAQRRFSERSQIAFIVRVTIAGIGSTMLRNSSTMAHRI